MYSWKGSEEATEEETMGKRNKGKNMKMRGMGKGGQKREYGYLDHDT